MLCSRRDASRSVALLLFLLLFPLAALGETTEDNLCAVFEAVFAEKVSTVFLPPTHPDFRAALQRAVRRTPTLADKVGSMTALILEVEKERNHPHDYQRPEMRDAAVRARETARARALKKIQSSGSAHAAPKVDVVGFSAGGSLAAIQARLLGLDVTGFETRSNPSRQVVLAVRQGVFDEWALVLGIEKAEQLRKQLARPANAVRWVDTEGEEHSYTAKLHPVDPNRAPSTATDLFQEKSNALVPLAELEAAMRKEATNAGVKVVIGERRIRFDGKQVTHSAEGADALADNRAPELVLDSRGAGGKNTDIKGYERIAVSPKRMQVAVVVEHDFAEVPEGAYYRWSNTEDAAGKPAKVLSQALTTRGANGKKRSWVVLDLTDKDMKNLGLENGATLDLTNDSTAAHGSLREVIARSMGLKYPSRLKSATLESSVKGRTTLNAFTMQMGINVSEVVAVGDQVGNGHWIAGGGAALAMTIDIDSTLPLLELLAEARRTGRTPSAEALQTARARQRLEALKSHAGPGGWIEQSILSFFPDLPAEEQSRFREQYREALRASGPKMAEGLAPFVDGSAAEGLGKSASRSSSPSKPGTELFPPIVGPAATTYRAEANVSRPLAINQAENFPRNLNPPTEPKGLVVPPQGKGTAKMKCFDIAPRLFFSAP